MFTASSSRWKEEGPDLFDFNWRKPAGEGRIQEVLLPQNSQGGTIFLNQTRVPLGGGWEVYSLKPRVTH